MDLNHPQEGPGSGIPTLVLCKPAFEAALREEIAEKNPGLDVAGGGAGWWLLERAPIPTRPWVFERQRLPRAHAVAGTSRRDLAEAAWRVLADGISAGAWTLHAFAPDPTAPRSLQKRAAGIGAEFLACLADRPAPRSGYREPRDSAGGAPVRVVQLCLTERGLFASGARREELSAPWPGGVHQIASGVRSPKPLDTPRAPSRSAMKIEEALEMFGEAPRPGQRVVDLGAAPGGWTLAFLRRGCRVTAVDRAALRIGSGHAEDGDGGWGGSLEHRREDGLRYRPPSPVDWLLSDMLVPPGVTLGLLRKWIGEGWMGRFIVNVKIPQRHPFSAVRPIEAFLAQAPVSRAGIRQLHHDRREVTLWGCVDLPKARPAKPSRTPKPGARR